MRAGVFLELLTEQFDVTLCVVQIYGRRPFAEDQRLLSRCETFVHYAPDDLKALGKTAPELVGTEFTHVHVFRLVMASWLRNVMPPLQQRPKFSLDLDDYESQTQLRFAELYAANGMPDRAAAASDRAAKAQKAEEQVLPFFDEAYVCSNADRATLADRFPTVRFAVVPNVVRMPDGVPKKTRDSVFQFLFVGTMAYYPNEDAIVWFCTEVVPLLRSMEAAAFRVTAVGRISDAIGPLAEIPEVEIRGEVQDLAACYREADAAVVPIRAGGGTRIKILEAMSFGTPIVSTTAGAEGLELQDGEQLLIANSAEAFATACMQLMTDSTVGLKIATSASEWVRAHHGIDNARAALTHGLTA